MNPPPFVARRQSRRLSAWALALFAAGWLVFAAQRHWLGLAPLALGDGPVLRGSLPSFVHTYAFVLLGCVWLARNWRQAWIIGGLCWALDMALEALQHPAMHQWLGSPPWVRAALVSTFDIHDLAAITLGLAAGWLSLAWGRAGQNPGSP
jgi:hypothetical protein